MFNEERGHLVKLDDNTFVERDVLDIVQRIREYDSNLRVQFLNDAAAGMSDAPYRIIEYCKDGKWRTVFSVWQLDNRVLERLYAADTQRHMMLDLLDKNNNGIRQERKRRYEEKRETAKDIVEHIFKSNRGRYTFTDEVDGVKRKVYVDDDVTSGPAKVEIKE